MLDKFRKRPAPQPIPGPWRRAAGRMDEALQKNAPTDYSEQIEMLGRQLFGHPWEPRNPSDPKD